MDDLDTVAVRTLPLSSTSRSGPRRTVAATVGDEAHERIREVAERHGVAISRIVALIVDDALEHDSPS